MLDAKFIRENIDELKDTIERQKKPELLDSLNKLLELDEEWRKLKKSSDSLRSERNQVSEAINNAKKQGLPADEFIKQAKEIPQRLKDTEDKMLKLEVDMHSLRKKIPNVMHKDVPFGKDETENVEIKTWGDKPKFSFKVKNHVEITEELGVADFEQAATTTGNGFYFLKGDLGLLNQALLRFAFEKLTLKGYTYVEPPLMVRKHILDSAMDTDAFDQTIYRIVEDSEDPLCMIGTAEHVLLGMHENEILTEDELPKKYAGYSMCFRQEIGSHGINEKGLWRTHQFNKVEQFIFCLPEQSWDMYDELLANSEEILQELKLPYRVIELCTGDLAVWKSRSHDLEVWRPTTEDYGEVMSCSNCTNYQATDLNIRYKKRDGDTGVVHTLNNTALATSRIMVAILENYQQEDGSVIVPEVLRPYMMDKEKLEPIEKGKKY